MSYNPWDTAENSKFDLAALAALVENSSDLVSLVTFAGQLIYLNPSGRALLGISMSEDISKMEISAFAHQNKDHSSDQDLILPTVIRAGRWSGPRVFQNLISGQEIAVDQTSFLVRDLSTNEPLYVAVIARDVGAQKRLLERLRLFESAVENSNDAIVISDFLKEDHPVIYVNAAFSEITGYEADDAVGRNLSFLDGDPDQPGLTAVQLALTTESPCRAQISNRRKDGSLFWNDVTLSPLKDREGRTSHYLGVQRDVTKDKQAREELELTTRRMQLVLTSVEMGTWEYDLKTEQVQWDDQMYRLFKTTRENCADPRPLWNLIADCQPAAPDERPLQRITRIRKSLNETTRVDYPGGKFAYIRTLAQVVRDDQGEPLSLLGVAWDVTQEILSHNLIEEQKVRMLASARLANLGEMAGGIAHEINDPLAIISAFTDRIRESSLSNTLKSEDLHRSLDTISKTVKRIADIVKGLRYVARDGSQDSFELTQVGAIVYDALSLCSERARSKGVQISVQGDINVKVECRGVQISQVLTNLLSNSFHAVEGTRNAKVQVEVEDLAQEVLIRVIDNGHGVPLHLREKVFQPFFTTKATGTGTGLGLSISMSLVKEHGGDLVYDSSRADTCFLLRLPKVQSKSNSRAA